MSNAMNGPAHRTTGSAFDALFEPEEAALLKVKATFLRALACYVDGFETQQAAAEALGVAQPRVSEIANGKISAFSLDLLVKYCERAGIEVKVEATYHADA